MVYYSNMYVEIMTENRVDDTDPYSRGSNPNNYHSHSFENPGNLINSDMNSSIAYDTFSSSSHENRLTYSSSPYSKNINPAYTTLDGNTWNTPAVKEEFGGDSSECSSDASSSRDWSAASKKSKLNSSRDKETEDGESSLAEDNCKVSKSRSRSHGKTSPLEEERRRIRRERNKLAAARCRQRRVDLTNQLLSETELLEDQKRKLEKEISNLERQRHELQFVLQAHEPKCTKRVRDGTAIDLSGVKVEKSDDICANGSFGQSQSQQPPQGSFQVGRPSSLALPQSSSSRHQGGYGNNLLSDISPGFQLTLDCMLNGHTGLTPITGSGANHNGSVTSSDLLTPSTLMNL